MDDIVDTFIDVSFQLDAHVADFVDWSYGYARARKPPRAAASRASLADIAASARSAARRLRALQERRGSGERQRELDRVAYLQSQLACIAATADMKRGASSYDSTAQLALLYDVRVPRLTDDDMLAAAVEAAEALSEIRSDEDGDNNDYPAPSLMLPATTAMTCVRGLMVKGRAWAQQRLRLPTENRVVLEAVSGVPWGAYNCYRGGFTSRIQVNVDQPLSIPYVAGLAMHEAYLGHHAHACLLEQHMVRARRAREFTMSNMLTPNGPVAEGLAEYGLSLVADTPSAMADLMHDVLDDPLDDAAYGSHFLRQHAMAPLQFSRVEIMRRLVDGDVTPEDADRLVAAYCLSRDGMSQDPFFRKYGLYGMCYAVGRDLVRQYNPDGSWERHHAAMASPTTPSSLVPPALARACLR